MKSIKEENVENNNFFVNCTRKYNHKRFDEYSVIPIAKVRKELCFTMFDKDLYNVNVRILKSGFKNTSTCQSMK